jgi:hypothetical protein
MGKYLFYNRCTERWRKYPEITLIIDLFKFYEKNSTIIEKSAE